MKTKSMILNPLDRARLSSYDNSKMQMNADGVTRQASNLDSDRQLL